jgi:hypothetical protein
MSEHTTAAPKYLTTVLSANRDIKPCGTFTTSSHFPFDVSGFKR